MKPSYRRAFVESEASTAIAHQIRVLRQQRGLTQQQLARKLGTTQAAISRLEDPSYGKVSVSTLVALSNVFDTALQVRFVSTVKYFRDSWAPKRVDFEVESFEHEAEQVGFYKTVPVTPFVRENSPVRALTVSSNFLATSLSPASTERIAVYLEAKSVLSGSAHYSTQFVKGNET